MATNPWVSVPAGVLAMGGCTPQVVSLVEQGRCMSFADVLSVELSRHAVHVLTPPFAGAMWPRRWLVDAGGPA